MHRQGASSLVRLYALGDSGREHPGARAGCVVILNFAFLRVGRGVVRQSNLCGGAVGRNAMSVGFSRRVFK